MTVLTEPQIIMSDGKPAFAVIPWQEYQELNSQHAADVNVWIPHEVVKATLLENRSIIRAWREYFGLTQQELAQRAGLSQPTLARLEKADSRPRTSTLKKLAAALGITVAQLSD